MTRCFDTPGPQAALRRCLLNFDGLAFAVLFGSRATGRAGAESDWDIAVQWQGMPEDPMEFFGRNETLRRELARCLDVGEERVDVVDLHRAGLALRGAVAEDGIPLYGEDSLAWALFLKRTWQDMEHWMLEQRYAP
ncbi:nucleotidyltransferase domain-containing protein [Billgrantia azerbaijanica]|nr:nucleotidyltransferase domain-containing protein [Halomonas azerbaijanica]